MNDDNAFPDYLRPCWTRIVYRQASPHARKEKQGYLYVVERGSERFWWYADVKAAPVPAESDSLHEWESEAKRAATWHVKRLYGQQQSQLVFGPWRPFELRGHELASLLLGHKGRSLTARDRLLARTRAAPTGYRTLIPAQQPIRRILTPMKAARWMAKKTSTLMALLTQANVTRTSPQMIPRVYPLILMATG